MVLGRFSVSLGFPGAKQTHTGPSDSEERGLYFVTMTSVPNAQRGQPMVLLSLHVVTSQPLSFYTVARHQGKDKAAGSQCWVL